MQNVEIFRNNKTWFPWGTQDLMKLHNIVILTTFTANMFQGYQILFFKALGDDIIVHKPTKYKIINITIINTNYKIQNSSLDNFQVLKKMYV